MSRKINDLEFRCQIIEHRLEGLEKKLNSLNLTVERLLADFDRKVDARVNDKTRVMVVDSLAAYQKGKAIKKQVDYISEVLKDE